MVGEAWRMSQFSIVDCGAVLDSGLVYGERVTTANGAMLGNRLEVRISTRLRGTHGTSGGRHFAAKGTMASGASALSGYDDAPIVGAAVFAAVATTAMSNSTTAPPQGKS